MVKLNQYHNLPHSNLPNYKMVKQHMKPPYTYREVYEIYFRLLSLGYFRLLS